MAEPRQILAVVGPNGSGKSSAVYRAGIERELLFVNPDDIARNDFAGIDDEETRNRLAWTRCNELRDDLIRSGISFGFETVGSHPSKVDLLRDAKESGYRVGLLFVATESPDINVHRIEHRISQGGHPVPEDKVRSRYYRTLQLLKDFFEVADTASVWDNSEDGNSKSPAIRHLVRKAADGSVTIFSEAQRVQWVKRYLLDELSKTSWMYP
jgi:predicted ABC-type ATPase